MDLQRNAEMIETALVQLRERTGLEITQEPPEFGPGQPADGRIRITQGDLIVVYGLECRTQVDREATLHQVLKQFQQLDGPGLLVAPYLAPELARKCLQLGLGFLDAAGNAYLNQKGLCVVIAGQKPDKVFHQAVKPMRAFDRTGLRVVFALIADPILLQAPYRVIAKTAGAALGTVSGILAALKDHGFLVEDRKGYRRWIDRERVIQTWAINYPLRLRARLHTRRFKAKDDGWWKEAMPERFNGYWGGEIAAAKLIGELVPKTATLYLPEDRKPFLLAHRLRADAQGPIEVLDAFWGPNPLQETHAGIAPPLLVYADLQQIGDPRTLEQARLIHDHYLA